MGMKNFVPLTLFCSLILSLTVPLWAEDESSSAAEQEVVPRQQIEQLMSEAEFTATGLDKLSPEELARLNAWLYGYTVAQREAAVEEAIPDGEESFGLEQVTKKVVQMFRQTPERIESTIEGNFRGWRGGTVFRLANGQVWKQTDRDRFVVNLDNPTIIIRKAMSGSYLLKVEGYGSVCRVRRVE